MYDNFKPINPTRLSSKFLFAFIRMYSLMVFVIIPNLKTSAQTVGNIRTTPNNEKVVIEYDLIGGLQNNVDVLVRIKINDSTVINPEKISGDLNGVLPGKNKRIVWEALKEMGEMEGEIVVQLTLYSSHYNEVKIGKQVWMSENLDVDRFKNGDLILEAKTADEWAQAGKNKQAAWCYYNNDPYNGQKFGKLYNWYAVIDPRGLAPKGWHIPSNEDWAHLSNFLGGESAAGKKMKSTRFWANNEGESGNGTNESGFSGLPGGTRHSKGNFMNIRNYGGWWSTNENDVGLAWTCQLSYSTGIGYKYSSNKAYGFSVRCLRD